MAEKGDKPSSPMTKALAEAEGLTDQFDDAGMMGKAVQKGCSEAFIAKDLNPVRKLQVSRDDKGQAFIKLRAKSKQGLSTLVGKGDEAQLIQDNQIQFESRGDETMQAMFILGLQEFIDQISCRPETHLVTLPTGHQGNSDSQVSFSASMNLPPLVNTFSAQADFGDFRIPFLHLFLSTRCRNLSISCSSLRMR
jgi:hypothetical protein